ncbi:MAG: hypothetical protein F6J94_17275 [Moorea sp. SIO1F2]|uniref:hypothetical protein n=1 Tax=unclassified Moorena TaxID=2683338 RepID=UPI0013BA9BFF|nr:MULTISPECIES: hypothetical protein [unclassified Moorena]NEN95933.1 hypothetical protein [Moorena sp. SIO3I7]NEO04043.1 hypothetical protein [Moorena sp. SIO3I8]NET83607.1 hypothetical protein [Moorena sp. SIO1F2]
MENVNQITLSLPTDLLKTTEELIQTGLVKNLEELVVLALHHEIVKIKQLQQNNQQLQENSNSVDDPIWGLGDNPVVGGVSLE